MTRVGLSPSQGMCRRARDALGQEDGAGQDPQTGGDGDGDRAMSWTPPRNDGTANNIQERLLVPAPQPRRTPLSPNPGLRSLKSQPAPVTTCPRVRRGTPERGPVASHHIPGCPQEFGSFPLLAAGHTQGT